MRNISNERFVAANVMIEFEDGPVSFRISSGAPLELVSEKVGKIGRWHRGGPLSIEVRFGTVDGISGGCAGRHPLIASAGFSARPIEATAPQ